ncbi:MAG: CpsB/CapC family capsule biosynthesis tyrosine phosphatase, partial [Oscillibacter sp.]
MSVVDFHAHILPNADHGSDSIDTSLSQLAGAEAVGVTHIVATPHFYPDHHNADDFMARRARCAGALAERYDGAIQITLGAEVLLCEGLAHLPQLPQLCVEGTNVLLIEMPLIAWARRHIEALFELRELGQFSIVLAHVDRYPPDQVEALLARGFLGQINADSLCHLMERKRLLRWVQQYDIVALG